MRFFFEDERDYSYATADDLADCIEASAFEGPVGAFGQGSIQTVDAGRLLIDFSANGQGSGEVFRDAGKVFTEIISAVTGLSEQQFAGPLRRLGHRYWAEGEAMAIARISAPAAPHLHSAL